MSHPKESLEGFGEGETWSALLSASGVGVLEWGEGECRANGCARELLSPGISQMGGDLLSYLACVAEADRAEVENALQEAPLGKQQREIVHRVRGEADRFVKISFLVDGQRCKAILQDITRTRQKERALEDGREMFLALSRITSEGLVFSHNGVIQEGNGVLLEMLGFSEGETRGIKVLDLVHPEDRDLVSQHVAQGIEEPCVHRVVHNNGNVLHVEARACTVRFRGQTMRMTAVRDITLRKHAQDELQRREEGYRNFIAQVSEGIWCLEVSPPVPTHLPQEKQALLIWERARVAEINSALASLLGLDPSDAPVGQRLADIASENRSAIMDRLRRFVASAHNDHGEPLVFKTRDRRAVHVLTSARGTMEDGSLVRIWDVSTDVSAMIAMKERLRQSKLLMEAIVENSPAIIFTKDLEGRYTLVNQRWEKLFGLDRDNVLGKTDFEIFPEDTAAAFRKNDAIVIARECTLRKRESAPLKNGEMSTQEAIKFPIRNAEGEIYGLGGIVVDRTQHEQTALALRDSEERFESAFLNAGHGMALVGKSREWIRVNQAFCDFFGYSEEELQHLSFADLTHPEDLKKSIEGYLDVVSGKTSSWQHEKRYIRKDGSVVWAHLSIALVRDIGGEPLYNVTQLHDITARKQALEALREREEMISSLVDNSSDWIWAVDREGIVTYSNLAMTRILGFSSEEILGKPYDARISEDDREMVRAYIYRKLTDKEGWSGFIVRWVPKQGCERYLESNASPVFDASGEFMGFRGVDRDVTKRVLAEESRKTLEDMLQKSQKMEAVGQLAGGVAHDFNNILTAILGNVQLASLCLMDENPNLDELQQDMSEIEQSAQRAASLTRQLLAFSRRQESKPQVLDLRGLLGGMEAMLRRLIHENVLLEVSVAPSLHSIRADGAQIEQVILNLVVNASDAMPEGGAVSIQMQNVHLHGLHKVCQEGGEPGPYVCVAVQDTGTGIAPETLTHIFEPFFSTKEVGKGTGLGLAMVYGIVQQSNAHIVVESSPGEGCTFCVYFPAVYEQTQTPEDEAATGAFPTPTIGDETILICEDDISVRRLTTQILKRAGYEVLASSDPEEAIRMAARLDKPIDLLLTDVVMPVMNGHKLSEILRAKQPKLKVLFVSGYTDNIIQHTEMSEDFTGFLEKPFSREDLLRKVRAMLEEGGLPVDFSGF